MINPHIGRYVQRILQGLILIFIGVAAFAIFGYFVLHYKIQGNRETKIEENVVLRFDQPTEYINGKSFWWLTEGSNIIKILNFSNEGHKGQLQISLQQNPCSSFEYVKTRYDKVEFDETQENILYVQDFKIGPYETKIIETEVINSEVCQVSNGDKRKFGAKIDGWVIR